MKDLLRRGLAMLMSVIMMLSLFVGYLPMEAFADQTVSSNAIRPQVDSKEKAPEGQITISSSRENNTLEYIGDKLTLTATLEGVQVDTDRIITTWSSSDESAATVENGVVTAKNFHPTESDLKRTVTITVTMTELSEGDAEEKVYEGNCEVVVQYSIQPLFYYALIPEHDETVKNGNGDSDWFGIGVELIAGAKPATGESRDVGNLQYEYVGIRKPLYPEITYNGKTYTHNSTTGNGYTLDQFRIVSDSTANGGYNGYNVYNGETDPAWTYHVDHRLNFTEPGDYCNVHFMVKYPGEPKFTLDKDSMQNVEKGTSESKITRPDPSSFPDKEQDGIVYTFNGWYTDEEFNLRAEFNGTITDNTKYYGRYVATQANYKVKFFYDGTEDQSRTETRTDKIGTVISSTSDEIQRLIQENTVAGYNFNTATPSSITLTEKGTNEIEIHYTKRNFTVSYVVDGKPAGVSDPRGGPYEFEASVTAAEMNVPGYDFNGWMTTDIDADKAETTVAPGTTFDMPGNNVTLKGTLTPKTDTPYKVQHWKQNLADDAYTLTDTEDLKGTTGTTVTAKEKAYPGYSLNPQATNAMPSGVITGDGKLVLRLYYDRGDVQYKVQHYLQINAQSGMTEDNYKLADEDEQLSAELGSEVTAQPRTYNGYELVAIDELTVDKGVVNADGTLVLKLYYNKAAFKVDYVINSAAGKGNEPATEYHAEGATATAATPRDVPGYTFVGWAENASGKHDPTPTMDYECGQTFTMPGSHLTLHGWYVPNTTTKYTVEHYLQNADDDLYTLKETDITKTGTTGEAPNVTPNRYDGFTHVKTEVVNKDGSQVIAGDESTVVKLYYDRNIHTVSYTVSNNQLPREDLPKTISYKYGQTVSVEAQLEALGYDFTGWTTTSDLGISHGSPYGVGDTFLMPDKNVVFTGEFTAKDNIPYTIQYKFEQVPREGEPFARYEEDPSLKASFQRTGKTWDEVSALEADKVKINGFTFINDPNISDLGVYHIAGDGSLVIGLCYSRNEYKVTYTAKLADGTPVPLAGENPESHKHGYTVDVKTPLDKPGYTFSGWRVTSQNATIATDTDGKQTFVMPIGDVTLEGIYTPNQYNYTINHYLFNTDTPLPDMPAETGKLDFGSPLTVDVSSLTVPAGYTLATTEDQSITIGTDAETNVINIYYYKNVTVKAVDNGKMFGTVDPALTAAVDENELFEGDTSAKITFNTPKRANGEDAGTYEITVDGKEIQGYYMVTYKPGTFTISASTALGVVGKDHTVVYDGKTYGEAATVSGPTAGVTVEYSTDGEHWSTDFPTVTNVADSTTVTVKASCANYETAEDTYTLTVAPREVLLDGNQNTVPYDGKTHSVSGVEAKGVSGKAESGLVGTHTLEGADFAVTDQVNAGTYTEKVVVTKVTIMDGTKNVTANYEVKAGRDVQLTITPLEITIKPKTVTATYDGKEHTATEFEYVGSNRPINGDTLTASFAGEAKAAGTYKDWSSIDSYAISNGTHSVKENYKVKTETGDIVIRPRSITLTSEDANKMYDGTPLTHNKVIVGGQGFAEGEGATFSFTGTRTNAGENKNSFSFNGDSGTALTNYSITKVEGTLTVTKAPIKISSGSATRVYNGKPLTNGIVDVTVGNATTKYDSSDDYAEVTLLNGETCFVKAIGTRTEVGEAKNEVSILWKGRSALAENYEISSSIGTLTVTQSADEIVVTTTGGIFTYDGLPHRATVTVSELPEGYTLQTAESDAVAQTVLDGTVEAKCDELVILNAKGEDVTDALNIRYVNSRLIINRAPLYITTQSATKEYDGEPLTAGVTVTGLVNNETVSVMPTGSQTEIGSSQNGYHVAWVGTAKVYNYEIEETLGTLTVTPVGQVPEPQNEDDDTPPDVRVVETMLLEDEIVPLAGNTEKCCILHFLLALLALITVLISGHDTKKLQEKITELKKETPENGADDSRTDGGKDDN